MLGCESKLNERGRSMLDIIFVVATAVFFAVGILYVRACERLR